MAAYCAQPRSSWEIAEIIEHNLEDREVRAPINGKDDQSPRGAHRLRFDLNELIQLIYDGRKDEEILLQQLYRAVSFIILGKLSRGSIVGCRDRRPS